MLLLLGSAAFSFSGTLSDPEVDRYNMRVGTQTFSGLYHFTTNTLLVETANAIHDMGSDTIKMYLASNFPGKYGITLAPNITNLITLARDEPSCRHVLDMPFRNFIAWTYPFAYWWPFDGYSSSERSSEYREFYDLTRYFLTNYNNSGKTFYLGHWEGDGYLTGGNFSTNPTPTNIQGFIDCLNNRQKAIDDAKSATLHSNVNVFCYAEANRVRDAINNNPNSNLRMINAVVPYVTNLDYLSYSSYDAQNLSLATMNSTLDYMEAHLPTNKVSVIPGERIWIGEYGYANSGNTPAQQEPLTRAYIQRLLNYGRQSIPFILFWEIYDNEQNTDGSLKYFYLIDQNNNKAPCYYLHQRFINSGRLLTAQFKERNGRLPSNSEFVSLVSPLLNQPLLVPVNLSVANLGASMIAPSSYYVSGSIAQGVYGDDQANVWVFSGTQDGGTVRSAWQSSQKIGVNANFNPTVFTALLMNVLENTNYFFRFYATNSSGESWAASSSQFSTLTLDPSSFAYRLKITFPGYNRGESLVNFPVLVNLSTNLPGFAYQQFASPIGGDLRFTDSGGKSLLPHEIDEWNTNGTSSIWVRMPQLASTNDYIWAYWGNPADPRIPASSTNGTVWASDHLLVWHLRETNFPYADSAQQNPAISGNQPASTNGEVGHASLLNGSSQHLDSAPINLGNAFTLSAWVKLDVTATNIQTVWANKSGGWNSDGFALYVNSYNTADQELRLETGDGTTGLTAATAVGAVSPGQWHRVAAVVDRTAGTAHLYVDGAERTQAGAIVADFQNQSFLNLGRFTNGSLYLKGTLDEVRIESGPRSSNWLWAASMTVAPASLFSTYSPVNPRPVLSLISSTNGPVLVWPTNAGPFALFSTTNFESSAWLRVPEPPLPISNQWQVPLNFGSDKLFYRLQQ